MSSIVPFSIGLNLNHLDGRLHGYGLSTLKFISTFAMHFCLDTQAMPPEQSHTVVCVR